MAVSIPANIVEDFQRKTKHDKARFLDIAQESAEECRYYLILAQDLGYGDSSVLMTQLNEVTKLLESYRKAVVSSSNG